MRAHSANGFLITLLGLIVFPSRVLVLDISDPTYPWQPCQCERSRMALDCIGTPVVLLIMNRRYVRDAGVGDVAA